MQSLNSRTGQLSTGQLADDEFKKMTFIAIICLRFAVEYFGELAGLRVDYCDRELVCQDTVSLQHKILTLYANICDVGLYKHINSACCRGRFIALN